MKIIDSYIDYLSSNPGEFTSLILWLITMTAVYIVLIGYRKKMVHGSEGDDGSWVSSEQVLYVINWVWPAVVTYKAYFTNEEWVKWFMFGVIAWALGGKWLFEWGLALRAGATTVPVETRTVIEKNIETKEKTTETKTEP